MPPEDTTDEQQAPTWTVVVNLSGSVVDAEALAEQVRAALIQQAEPAEKALLVTTTTTPVAPSHSSVCLMLRPPPYTAGQLALTPETLPPGSLVHTPEELHITLLYLGDVDDLADRRPSIEALVAGLAGAQWPIGATISGEGRFVPEELGELHPYYASVDSPELPSFRERLRAACVAAGIELDERHGFDPHITLCYLAPGQDVPASPMRWMSDWWFAFSELVLAWGNEQTAYPLAAEPPAPAYEAMEWASGHPPAIWVKSHKPTRIERKNDPASRTLKSLPHVVKDISGRTVVGISSVFGNLDSYDDISMPGSFAKTIRERGPKVYHLWQHDTTQPAIAVIERLQEVGRDALPKETQDRYPEALGGLEVARTYLEYGLASWVFDGLSKGVPYEMSYMYDPLAYEFVEREDVGRTVRLLYEQRLWETSDVLWGANSATVASKAAALDLDPIPLDMVRGQLECWLIRAQKAGARNSTSDLALINEIHALAVALGATNCLGVPNDAEEASKAATAPVISHASHLDLAALRTKLNYLAFINGE
jgi:HK97 family phage prohead protease